MFAGFSRRGLVPGMMALDGLAEGRQTGRHGLTDALEGFILLEGFFLFTTGIYLLDEGAGRCTVYIPPLFL